MKGKMEADRRRLEKATDADMPLGGFYRSLVQSTCATETKSAVDIEGVAFSGLVENVPFPSGEVFEGAANSQYANARDVKMRWSCRPE